MSFDATKVSGVAQFLGIYEQKLSLLKVFIISFEKTIH